MKTTHTVLLAAGLVAGLALASSETLLPGRWHREPSIFLRSAKRDCGILAVRIFCIEDRRREFWTN